MTEEFEKDMMHDLRAQGMILDEIVDLMNLSLVHRAIVPLLLTYFEKDYSEEDKEFLARCLGVRGLTEATDALIRLFENLTEEHRKWTVGNSLYVIADKKKLPEMLELVKNRKHGDGRQMIVYGLGRFRTEEVKEVLLSLLDDEDVAAHAIVALSKFKDAALIPILEPYQESDQYLVRKEAKKAVKRLQKYQ